MPLTVLPSKGDRFRVSAWIFIIAWLIGNLAMIAGFESAEGFLQNALVLGILATACGAWWVGYKLSNFRNHGGFVVIALWLLGPIIALLDFQQCIRTPFFWGSVFLLSLLVALALSAKPLRGAAGETPLK